MGAQRNMMFEQNKEEVRRQLREFTEQETEKFLEAAQTFYDQERRTQDQCLELTNAMITAIDNVLAAGDWESSLFLKNTIKPLKQLQAQALGVRRELLREQGLEEIPEYELKANEKKFFVSLYQADGHDLNKWAAQLGSIDSYMTGRPIYKNETDIQRAIRHKLLQTAEAYAVIVVDQSKVLGGQFATEKKDRNGYALVTIEVNIVKAKDVIEFVHSGARYHYHNQHLILKKKK